MSRNCVSRSAGSRSRPVRLRGAAAVAGLAAVALALSACGAPADQTPRAGKSPGTPLPDLAAARAAAKLQPCPAPAATPPAATAGAERLPAVRLPCLAGGDDVDLAAAPGVPTVVNVWASWCLPCREEMPAFQRLSERASDRLRVMGIDSEDPPMTESLLYLAAEKARFPSVYDASGVVRKERGVPGLPFTLFLAADGRVVGSHVGALDDASLAAAVHRYLGVDPGTVPTATGSSGGG